MEIVLIIALVGVVAIVILKRKRSGKPDVSTGNPSANEGDDKI